MWVHPEMIDLLDETNKRVKREKLYKIKSVMDYFFISFPKSGRTWIFAFLQMYLMYFFKQGLTMPGHSVFWPLKRKKPKIAFTHRLLDYCTGTKTVYILRDPRDVLVSYYFQSTLRTCSVLPGTNISEFIRSEKMGMPQLLRYHHVFHTLLKQSERSLVIRYEDLKTRDLEEWHRLIRFMDLEPNYKLIKHISKVCSFDSMKAQLKNPESFVSAHPSNWQFMAMEDGEVTVDPKNPESHKLRKGLVGGYKEYLPERDIAYLESEMKHMPEGWKYE